MTEPFARLDLAPLVSVSCEIEGRLETFPLRLGENHVGSHPDNDLVVASRGVSRRHAVLDVGTSGITVRDLGSKNGTQVNGRRVASAAVAAGDEILLGETALRLEELDADDQVVGLPLGKTRGGRNRPRRWQEPDDDTAGDRGDALRGDLDDDLGEPMGDTVGETVPLPGRSGAAPWLRLLGDLVTCLDSEAETDSETDSDTDTEPHSGSDGGKATVAAATGKSARGPALGAAVSLLVEELALEALWVIEPPQGSDSKTADPETAHLETVGADEPTVLAAAGSAAASGIDSSLGDVHGDQDEARIVESLRLRERRELRLVAVPSPTRALPLEETRALLQASLRLLAFALRRGAAPEDRDRTSSRAKLRFPDGYHPGRSRSLRRLHAEMLRVSRGDVPVLILGETGVGKELVARTLYRSSDRREGPFVAVNCAAIPAELLEAELFGVEKGAATGVTARQGRMLEASGGTLFLDEIGDMSPELQAKLLRALQEQEIQPVGGKTRAIDVRVISATHADLPARIADGTFRRDLYYRLAGAVLEVPPLRERCEDLPGLIEHFTRRFARQHGKSPRGYTVKALRLLTEHAWPGNIRELEHEIRRLVSACEHGRVIDSIRLSPAVRQPAGGPGAVLTLHRPSASAPTEAARSTVSPEARSAPSPGAGVSTEGLNLEEIEKRAIVQAMAATEGNKSKAALLLGISRDALRRRLQRYGLE